MWEIFLGEASDSTWRAFTEGRSSESNLFPRLCQPPLRSLWSHAQGSQGIPSGLLQVWFLNGLASESDLGPDHCPAVWGAGGCPFKAPFSIPAERAIIVIAFIKRQQTEIFLSRWYKDEPHWFSFLSPIAFSQCGIGQDFSLKPPIN